MTQNVRCADSNWHGKSSTDTLAVVYGQTVKLGLYPNVEYLLKLLLTIPVTSATSERSNSTVKYIKNNLRSTISQGSLNACVLGYRHKDLMGKIKTGNLVKRFINKKRRRLLLANPVAE